MSRQRVPTGATRGRMQTLRWLPCGVANRSVVQSPQCAAISLSVAAAAASERLGGAEMRGDAASTLLRQRLLGLFVLALLLFNFPLLALWDHPLTVAGLPLFPLALFGLWALLIGVLALWMERGADPD